MNCAVCQRDMHHAATNPVCMQCRSSRTCSGCDTRISYRSKGKCRTCANAELRARPDHAERQRLGTIRYNQDPSLAAERKAKALKAARTKAANPELVEKMRESGRRNGAANIIYTRSPAAREKAARSISATKMAKVPEAYRPMYRELRRINVSADEALAAVLEQRAVDERRRIAALTPFQRQMERVRNGAALIAKPDYCTGGPEMTLGGVSGGLL